MSNAERFAELLGEMNAQQEALGKMTPQLKANADFAAAGLQKFEGPIKGAGEAAKQFAGAFVSAGKAMYEGQKGLTAYNQSVDQVATGIKVLGTALGALIGGPIGLLVAGISMAATAAGDYVKAANEQTDKLFQSYQEISRSGAATVGGLDTIYADLRKLGLNVNELSEYTALIGENAKDLATLGGSVSQGAKQFAEVGEALKGSKNEFMNLGMTQKEINEASMGYIKLQSKLGTTQNKTATDLADSTRKYLYEQDALTKLTGLNRKQQEKAREAALAQERFAAVQLELRAKGKDKEAKALQDTYMMMLGPNGEMTDAAQGFLDISTGNLQTEAAQKSMRETNGESLRVAQQITDGQMTAAQGADKIIGAIEETVNSMGAAQGKLGNYNTNLGNLAQSIELIARRQSGSLETQAKNIEDNQKKQAEGANKEIDRLSKNLIDQQKAANDAQDLVRVGADLAGKATKAFADVTNSAIGKINNLVGAQQRTAPAQPAAAPAAPAAAPAAPPPPAAAAPAAAPTAAPAAAAPAPTTTAAAPAVKPLRFTSGTGSESNFRELTEGLQNAVLQAGTEYASLTKNPLIINSAKRDPKDQERIYQETVDAGRPGIGPTGMAVGKPGRSKHEIGQAVDIQQGKSDPQAVNILGKYGLVQAVPKDPVHFQVSAEDGGIFSGPKSGYPAMLHGNEAVVPLDDNLVDTLTGLKAELGAVTEQMLLALEEMSRNQRESNDIDRRMLQLAQN